MYTVNPALGLALDSFLESTVIFSIMVSGTPGSTFGLPPTTMIGEMTGGPGAQGLIVRPMASS